MAKAKIKKEKLSQIAHYEEHEEHLKEKAENRPAKIKEEKLAAIKNDSASGRQRSGLGFGGGRSGGGAGGYFGSDKEKRGTSAYTKPEGYYSRPDSLWADTEALYQAVQEAERNVRGATEENYGTSVDAYNAAVDQYNAYVTDQQSKDDEWRSRVRDESAILADIERLEREQSANSSKRGEIYSFGTPYERQGELDELNKAAGALAEEELRLREELDWAKTLRYQEVQGADDFDATVQKVRQGGSAALGYDPGLYATGKGEDPGAKGLVWALLTSEENKRRGEGDTAINDLSPFWEDKWGQLNEKERNILLYYVGKGQLEEAEAYLAWMEGTANTREGKRIGEEIASIDNELLRQIVSTGYVVGAGVGNAVGGIAQKFSADPAPISVSQAATPYIEAGLEDVGFKIGGKSLGQYIFNAGNTVGNMLPSIVVGSLFGPGVGAATMSASVAGNSYTQALQEGYTKEQATRYGLLVGASEGVLQYLLGGISKLGGGKLGSLADDALLERVAAFDRGLMRAAGTAAIKIGSEIREEELQLFLEPLIKTAVFGVEYDPPTIEEMVETAITTALSTGALEGGDIVSAALTPPSLDAARAGSDKITPENGTRTAQDARIAPDVELPAETADDTQTPTRVAGNAVSEGQQTQVPAFGENGQRVAAEIARETGQGVEEVTRQMETAYDAGRKGVAMPATGFATQTQERAFIAGRQDHISDMGQNKSAPLVEDAGQVEGGAVNGSEEVHLREGSQRDDGAHPGGQVSPVAQGTRGDQGGQEKGRPADGETAVLTYGGEVAVNSLGIAGGSQTRKIRMVTGGETASMKAARDLARERGLRPFFFAGDNLRIKQANGIEADARAYITGDRVFIRVDHPDFTSDQLMRHEAGHDMIAKGEIDPTEVQSRVREELGEERARQVSQAYIDLYDGTGLTPEQIWEEVICDSLGDMNVFSDTVSEGIAAELLGETKKAVEATRKEGNGAAASPGRMASIDLTFADKFQSWYNSTDQAGRVVDGGWFEVGTTSAPLKSIGVRDGKVYWRKSKLGYIMMEHPEMTPEIIKQVPGVIEDPVIVLKSLTQPDSVTVFSELHANGRPVMVAVNLTPVPTGGVEAEFSLITSAYDRGKTSAANLIERSDVLYLSEDKKRTDTWLMSLGLQLPSGQPAYGSVGSITYEGKNVNIKGVPWSEILSGQAVNGENSLEFSREKVVDVAERLAALVEQYGAIKPGENPARDIQVPKKTADNKKVSQTARTILEAKATPDEALPDIEKMVADGTFSYEVYGDKQAISDAEGYIKNVGWNAAQREWFDSVKKGHVDKRTTTVGWMLYNNAVNSGDTQMALDVLNQMVQNQRNAAQAVQATRILKKLSPETQIYGVVRSVARLQQDLNDRYGTKKGPALTIDPALAEQLLSAKDENQRAKVMQDIYKDIGKQMPSRFIDKWNAWRYLAMLGNPRTHVRNVLGNVGFTPVVAVKNLTATAIEAAADRVSGGRAGRSKGVLTASKKDRDLVQAAWKDFAEVQEAALGGGKYSDMANANRYIEEGRRVFGRTEQARTAVGRAVSATVGRAVEASRKGNSSLLDMEDMWFSRPHYMVAMAGYCKANGITAEQIAKGQGLEKARAYAVKEAQKATYRDVNAFSTLISGLGRSGMRDSANPFARGMGTVIEGILPFRKTPANILARGIEYSPAGLLKGMFWDMPRAIYAAKSGNTVKNQKTPVEIIDEMSAGLTGTGLLALGILLASQGLIRGHGGDDEEKKKFEEMMGHQSYSLEAGDTSVTLDWLAPECLPFFVGVNLWEATGKDDEKVTLSALLNATKTVTEPLLEMSCLQSLNEVFDAVGYATSDGLDGLPAALASSATSYLTQALPTILGQAERTGQDIRMTTFTQKDNPYLTSDMQYTLGQASSRLPGWDFQQIPYIDAWGRTESTGGAGARAANNMLNPAYTSTIETSKMEAELLRLFDETGEASVFPGRAAKSVTVSGEDKYLTAEEYVKYAQTKGQTAYKILTDLTGRSEYKRLSDGEKVEAVGKVYEYANAVAKKGVSKYEPGGWLGKAMKTTKKENIPVDEYILLYLRKGDIVSLKDKEGKTITNSTGLQIMEMLYQTSGLSDKQRQALFQDFGVGQDVIHYNPSLVAQKLAAMRKKAR